MSELLDGPWLNLCADFWGPTPDGKYVLVIVDEYSRYPVVDLINSTVGSTVMPVFDKYFSYFGIPEVLETDNGTPFHGDDFATFADYLGFDHRKITPLWPQSNAEGERFMPNEEKAVVTVSFEGNSWKQELFKYLHNYRATPHSSTQTPPATALFGRPLSIRLSNVTSRGNPDLDAVS